MINYGLTMLVYSQNYHWPKCEATLIVNLLRTQHPYAKMKLFFVRDQNLKTR